jgi:hypothetical protein
MTTSRRSHRADGCRSKLRMIAITASNYATDYQDRLPGFSWRAGECKSEPYADLANAASDLDAVVNQAVWVLRYRAQMTGMAPIPGWLPNVAYSDLTLDNYLPQSIGGCPEDAPRARDKVYPEELSALAQKGLPLPSGPEQRWRFSTSYQYVPATYSPDQLTAAGPTISQGSTDGEFLVPNSHPFGTNARKMSEVAFPAKKVFVFDTHDRHYARQPLFYASPAARQPLAFFDMSARACRTSNANPGFQPNDPASPDPTVFTYKPEGEARNWYPAPTNPDGDRGMKGYYRWTRGGLKGIDFSSAEPQSAAATAPQGLRELLRTVER